jgi:hypothetical protein
LQASKPQGAALARNETLFKKNAVPVRRGD